MTKIEMVKLLYRTRPQIETDCANLGLDEVMIQASPDEGYAYEMNISALRLQQAVQAKGVPFINCDLMTYTYPEIS